MVDPVSAEERAAFTRKLQVAVTLLVGGSMGLATLGAGGALPQAGAATVAGLVVGVVVAWYIVPDDPMPTDRRTPPPPDQSRARDGRSRGELGEERERELPDETEQELPDQSGRGSADLERRD
jgi:hypothetical protein